MFRGGTLNIFLGFKTLNKDWRWHILDRCMKKAGILDDSMFWSRSAGRNRRPQANAIFNLMNRIPASTNMDMSLPFCLWCLSHSYIILETGIKKQKRQISALSENNHNTKGLQVYGFWKIIEGTDD